MVLFMHMATLYKVWPYEMRVPFNHCGCGGPWRNNTNMPVELDCDFPGGNIIVDDVDGNVARLRQDIRDSDRDWFYWCFRARGAAGGTARFVFTQSPAIGVRGPAVSLDSGRTWRWLGRGAVSGNSFSYRFPDDAPEARFGFGMPYQESDWQRFVRGIRGGRHFRRSILCATAKGRNVECALAGRLETEPECRVAVVCRHHACETMANYVLEGLLQWLLTDSCPEAQWMRTRAELLAVPFVDKDGVEDGDQGKGRKPRDHGRDYEGESIYASTRAMRALLPEWGADRLRVALDLHCPWMAGGRNETVYLVGSERGDMAAEQRRFSGILEKAAICFLPFAAEDFLAFGEEWNTAENYGGGKTFSQWADDIPGMGLSTSIEIPYANARGAEVNRESARAFGADLGVALARYLWN